MNVHAPFRPDAPVRARFTVEDVDRMVEGGVIGRDQPTELLDGDLIFMPSEGEPHLTFKTLVINHLARASSHDWWIVPDGTLHLSPEDAPEPDAYIVPAGSRLKPVDPSGVALVIEIADTSLSHDLVRKAPIYARYGIEEYWVVDLNARQTHVLTGPESGAYRDMRAVAFDEPLTSVRPPFAAVRFADLERRDPA